MPASCAVSSHAHPSALRRVGPSLSLVLSLVGAACQQQRTDENSLAAPTSPSSPSPTVSPSPTEEPPGVLGNLQVGFIKGTAEAKLPRPPVTVTMVLKPAGGGEKIEEEITDPKGAFTLDLPPGRYRVDSLLLESPSFGSGSIDVPAGGPAFRAPGSGCVYVGRIFYLYYRLPRGSVKAQQTAIEEMIDAGKVNPNNLYFIFLRSGSLVPSTGGVDLGGKNVRPTGWEDCTIKKAAF